MNFQNNKDSSNQIKYCQKCVMPFTKPDLEFYDKKIFLNAEKKFTKIDLFEYIEKIEKNKPGEILLTSVDHDGMMDGYDIETIKRINKSSNIHVIASGGAGSVDDIYKVIKETNVQAVAASSIFHFT